MNDNRKTKSQLIAELQALRNAVSTGEHARPPASPQTGEPQASGSIAAELRALEESEQRFRQLAENIREVFWLTDWVQRRVLYVSPTYETVWGRSCQSLIDDARSWADPIHPEDRERVVSAFDRQAEIGDYDIVYRIVRDAPGDKQGEVRWIHDRAFPIRDASGRVFRMAGISEDITTQKRAEIALRDSEARLRSITDSSPDFIMLVDLEHRIRFINRTLPGHAIERVVGTLITDYLSREAREVVTRCLDGVIATGRPDRYEIDYSDAAGRRLTFESRVGPVMREGEVVALAVNASDITQRKRAEEELRQLATAVASATPGIARFNADGVLTSVNEAFAAMLGRPLNALHGTPLADIAHADDAQRVEEALACMSSTGSAEFEARAARLDGTVQYLVVLLVSTEYHQLGQHYCFARDITTRKQAEERSRILESQLRQAQKVEAIGSLAAGTAHDFGNILAAISDNVTQARQRVHDDAEMNRLLEAIAQTTEQATSMTRSLLALSRDGHVALQPVDLPAVLRDAAELLRRLLPARIEFTTDIPDGRDMWINSEPSMIRQLLINLAVNARDAMPDGGVLKVSLSPPNRRAAADAGDAFARVCVEDTGVGMDAQVRQRVFEPFFTTKPRGAGTGLGLAVVRGIVSFHSGHVDIASQPGQGTRVTVHLPLCAAPPAPRATQRPSRQAAGNVLVVERDEHVAAIIAATLQAAGHEVVQAGTADQACASLQSHRKQKTPPIDLVILDTDGPSSDPFRCLRRIREIEAKLPVIATVGNVDPTVRCRLAQRTALLPKPFQMADLTELVQELLRPIP